MEVNELDVTHPAGPSRYKGGDSSLSTAPTIDAPPAGSPAITEPGTADVLIAARKLIEDPKDWCQGGTAFTANGERLPNGYDDGAVRWCVAGAVEAVTGKDLILNSAHGPIGPLGGLLNSLAAGHGSFATWQDTHAHAEVLAAFDKAIYMALEGL